MKKVAGFHSLDFFLNWRFSFRSGFGIRDRQNEPSTTVAGAVVEYRRASRGGRNAVDMSEVGRSLDIRRDMISSVFFIYRYVVQIFNISSHVKKLDGGSCETCPRKVGCTGHLFRGPAVALDNGQCLAQNGFSVGIITSSGCSTCMYVVILATYLLMCLTRACNQPSFLRTSEARTFISSFSHCGPILVK